MFKRKGYKIENYSFSVVIVTILLAAIGLIVLQSLTVTQNTNIFSKQVVGVMAGVVIMIIVSFIDYRFICKLCIPLYILNIFLMLVCRFVEESTFPYFYGKSVEDARRWIHIGRSTGGTDFMPSEITKIVIIICLARLFVYYEGKLNKITTLLILFAVAGFPILLVFLQPDLSTTIVISMTFICMLFLAGLSLKIVLPSIAIIIPLIYAFIWYVQQESSNLLLKSWQRDRILSILHPEEYPDLMYQQNNAATAINSGDIFGKMITDPDGKRMTKYVPVVESDFIFSGVGEELGFLGSFLVILLFAVLLFLAFKIALNARDKVGRYIACGIAIMISLQAFVNIGVVISILPNTGIPLPFLSSGLSSLLTNFATIGVLINIGLLNKDANPVLDDVIVFGKYHRKEL